MIPAVDRGKELPLEDGVGGKICKCAESFSFMDSVNTAGGHLIWARRTKGGTTEQNIT